MERVPKVTMNDGIRVTIRISPLRAPSAAGTVIARMSAIPGDPPSTVLKAYKYPATATSAPTDRSNSPAIISRVTPIDIVPVRVAALIMPEIERRVRKFGTKAEHRTKTTTSVSSGPRIGESAIARLSGWDQGVARLTEGLISIFSFAGGGAWVGGGGG